MADAVRVGFIGLGDMGGPIASRIIQAGFATTLWARRATSLDPYRDTAAAFAATPRDVGEASDVVGVCVFNDADVEDVLGGEIGVFSGLKAGAVVLVHSTISVEGMERLADEGARLGVHVLDAPVSGARSGAEAGRLAIMVGGDPTAFERARPVMQAYGSTVRLMGPPGSGQRMKVLNNVLGFCNLRMAHLALEVGGRLGLEAQAVKDVLRNASGSSFNLPILIDRLMPDPDFARHALTMTIKDTDLYKSVRAKADVGHTLLDHLAEEAAIVVEEISRRG